MEEAHPPTAQEAAELEAAELFVVSKLREISNLKNLMPNLDMLERKEDATRLVRAGLKKRLEATIERVRNQAIKTHKNDNANVDIK